MEVKPNFLEEVSSSCLKVERNIGMVLRVKKLSGNKNINTISMAAKQMAFDALFEKLPISFYWMNEKGIWLGCNDNELKLLGLNSMEEFVGKHSTELVTQEAWLNSKHVMEIKKTVIFEEVQPKSDGHHVTYLSIKSPIFNNDNNKVIGLLGISIDITERKKIEEELRIAKEVAEAANEHKLDFIHNMEHDIRTPFIGVWSLIDLLAKEETDSKKKYALEEVTKCAKELLDYCNNILEFSRINAKGLPVLIKKFELMRLIEGVMAIEQPPATVKKLNFSVECDADLPAVIIGDRYRLQRILINLISNAIKFTKNGFVKLCVKKMKQVDERTIILQFLVSDSGIGIPEEKQNIIYDKFIRLTPSNKGHYQGQGLGLRIVKQFIEEMDGDIEVHSIEQQGTTFACTLPFRLPLTDVLLEAEKKE